MKNLKLLEVSELDYFFYKCTGNVPYSFQSEILNDSSKRISTRIGRQMGKTELFAVKNLHKALKNCNEIRLIVSATQRQSDIMYSRIRTFAKNLFEDRIVTDSRELLKFDNGSEIRPLPSGDDGDKIRGFPATGVTFDEAAFINDRVFEAVKPSLAKTGGDEWYSSTPFGKKGYFYETFGLEEFSSHHAPASEFPEVHAPGFLDSEFKNSNKNIYNQEYEAEFISDADNFFTLELIKSCLYDYEEVTEPSVYCDYHLGIDQARMGRDETTYVIVEDDRVGNYRVVNISSTSKKPLTDIIGRTKSLHEHWNFVNIFMDGTGLGAGTVDVLSEEIPVTSVVFTIMEKERMYTNLKNIMEKGNLQFFNHHKLLREMQELEYEYSQTHLKIHHPKKNNAHDDFVDGLALACSGLSVESSSFVYRGKRAW